MASIVSFGSNSLSGTTQSVDSTQIAGANKAEDAGQTTTATPATTANSQADTVKLSEAAQAKLMHAQGQSINQIASSLGTTTKSIDTDLGITLETELAQTLQATESSSTSG